MFQDWVGFLDLICSWLLLFKPPLEEAKTRDPSPPTLWAPVKLEDGEPDSKKSDLRCQLRPSFLLIFTFKNLFLANVYLWYTLMIPASFCLCIFTLITFILSLSDLIVGSKFRLHDR